MKIWFSPNSPSRHNLRRTEKINVDNITLAKVWLKCFYVYYCLQLWTKIRVVSFGKKYSKSVLKHNFYSQLYLLKLTLYCFNWQFSHQITDQLRLMSAVYLDCDLKKNNVRSYQLSSFHFILLLVVLDLCTRLNYDKVHVYLHLMYCNRQYDCIMILYIYIATGNLFHILGTNTIQNN